MLDRKEWAGRLATEERRLGFRDGYKLLYCPWATIGRTKAAFISLNPGGRAPVGADMRVVSDERGNSYEVERLTTRSPITDQFLRFCAMIDVAPADVLTGVAAPFRSDDWGGLSPAQRRASLDLGLAFWSAALAAARPRLVVAVSSEAADLACRATGARFEREAPSGWGDIRLRRHRTPDGAIVVQLPHLSRFRLFGRAESDPALRDILRVA